MEDLANEALPMYAVIEPRYSNGIVNTLHVQLTPNCYPPNSNHPGAANFPPAGVNPVGPTNPPIDVADGEAFLRQLYNALQQSSYWNKTLLIITYDEHGGLYDHVAPPVASPPGQTTSSPSIAIPPVGNDDPVSNGFTFNVYGCRVPTILVSPYIAAGTQISPPASSPFFDHTSIIKTVWECFFTNGSPTNPPSVSSLTARDEAAPGLYGFLDFGIYNNPGQC